MKKFKSLVIVLAGLFTLAACQKELSFETGSLDGIATGSLRNLAGDCQNIVVRGQYIKDSTLRDSSYVVVQVDFASPGMYTIYTDVENGFSFRDSGYAVGAGLQSIRLRAVGKPLITQQTNFTVYLDSSYCTFSVNVTDTAVVRRDAVYTLASGGTTCANASVQGTYKQGTALDASNFVTVQMNVTSPGSYNIQANGSGIAFSSQGTFATTGVQTVTLKGSGTPTASGTDSIPISAGGTSCKFAVTVAAGTGGVGGGGGSIGTENWKFTQGTKTFQGNIDGADFGPDLTGGSGSILTITGSTVTQDSLFVINLAMPGNTIQNGTYTTTGGLFNLFSFSNANGAIYGANMGTTGAVITVTISYNATTKVLTGTFSGNANNASNQPVSITAGTFTATVQ